MFAFCKYFAAPYLHFHNNWHNIKYSEFFSSFSDFENKKLNKIKRYFLDLRVNFSVTVS